MKAGFLFFDRGASEYVLDRTPRRARPKRRMWRPARRPDTAASAARPAARTRPFRRRRLGRTPT